MPTHQVSAPQIAVVVSAHGRHVVVEASDGARVHCHTRGKRSDVVVGDHVRWAISGDQGVVVSIEPRRNMLYRQDEWRTKAFAANLDQVLLLVAVEPSFSDAQLTKGLIAAADAEVPAYIICNKMDLPGAAATFQRLGAYSGTDVETIPLALKGSNSNARQILTPLLHGKVTLVIGASGVGKSSLINLMVPDAEAQVGEISKALNSGKHTTTATRWYWMHGIDASTQKQSALIDTPGFQQFGLHHIAPDRLASLMPDIQRFATECKFYNCTHRHEPACGVVAALARGEVSQVRYRLYGELTEAR